MGPEFCHYSKMFALIMEVVSLIQRICQEGSTVIVSVGSILFPYQLTLPPHK